MLFGVSIENLNKPKILALSIICRKCKSKDEKKIKEDESIEILRLLGLTRNAEWTSKYESKI